MRDFFSLASSTKTRLVAIFTRNYFGIALSNFKYNTKNVNSITKFEKIYEDGNK
jgi:hypothetical protein